MLLLLCNLLPVRIIRRCDDRYYNNNNDEFIINAIHILRLYILLGKNMTFYKKSILWLCLRRKHQIDS